MEKKKYIVYVHKVNTEDGPMYYAGVTKQKLTERWRPGNYKKMSIEPYINRYGWDNIEHLAVFETIDREKAYRTEDLLIRMYRSLGKGINKNRSGFIEILDVSKYHQERYDDRQRQVLREYQKHYRTTPEGKIYNRVSAFNKIHPDLATETPLEAKRKYLDSGGTVIPQYIKHDDI